MSDAEVEDQPVVVAYCFDRHFAPYAAVSTVSLIKNSKTGLVVYWCVDEGDLQHAGRYVEAVNNRTAVRVNMVPVSGIQFSSWKTTHHFTTSTYLRLLLPETIPLKKLIYIDADTLVLDDLSELFSIDLGERPLAGVPDPIGERLSKLERSEDDTYVNTGVLLLNLERMRQEESLERCREIYRAFESQITWVDQCIINKYAENRKLALNPEWNRYCFSNSLRPAESRILVSREHSRILHFVGQIKPWQAWCNPIISSFWWRQAGELRLSDLAPVKITTIQQALEFAQTLDMNEVYKEASRSKTNIIEHLLKRARRRS